MVRVVVNPKLIPGTLGCKVGILGHQTHLSGREAGNIEETHEHTGSACKSSRKKEPSSGRSQETWSKGIIIDSVINSSWQSTN